MSGPGLLRQASGSVSSLRGPDAHQHARPGRPGVGLLDDQLRADALERSRMIFSPCESASGVCALMPSSPTSISAYGDRTVQRSQRFAAPECLRALAIASWAIRSSSYSTSPGSRGPFSSRVTCTAIGEVALTWLAYAERLSPRPGPGRDLVPQVEDRVAQLGDDAGHLLAQLADLLLLPGRSRPARGCPRGSRGRRRPGRPRRGPRARSAGAPRWSRCPARARTAGRPAAGPRAGETPAQLEGGARVDGSAASRTRTAIISSLATSGMARAARAASSPRTPSTAPRAPRPRPSRPGWVPAE